MSSTSTSGSFDKFNDSIWLYYTDFMNLSDLLTLSECNKTTKDILNNYIIYRKQSQYINTIIRSNNIVIKPYNKKANANKYNNKKYDLELIDKIKIQLKLEYKLLLQYHHKYLQRYIQSNYNTILKQSIYNESKNTLKIAAKSAYNKNNNISNCNHKNLILLYQSTQHNPSYTNQYRTLCLPYNCNRCRRVCLGVVYICITCTMNNNTNTANYNRHNDECRCISSSPSYTPSRQHMFCSRECAINGHNSDHYHHCIRPITCITQYNMPQKYIVACLNCTLSCIVCISAKMLVKGLTYTTTYIPNNKPYTHTSTHTHTNKQENNISIVEYICICYQSHLRYKLQSKAGQMQLLSQLNAKDIAYTDGSDLGDT